jgi:hypothetical protein
MSSNLIIASFLSAIVLLFSAVSGHGATAAFSDDGNHVYLIGSQLPKGTALDIDLTTFTATKMALGVATEVRAIANAPRALLFLTEKSLYRLPLPAGEAGKICDAPKGYLFDGMACNRALHGILLSCRTKDGRDWSSYYLKEKETVPALIVTRRAAIAYPVFDRDGHLFFVAHGDIWEGTVELPTELNELPSIEASRFAPIAMLETANATPNSTGARELAVAGRTVYAQMSRMGGTGWGEIVSVRWPGDPNAEELKNKHYIEGGVEAYIDECRTVLDTFDVYGPNQGPSYLCASSDGRKVFFATRGEGEGEGENQRGLRFYLGDDAGEVKSLDQLKIDDPR